MDAIVPLLLLFLLAIGAVILCVYYMQVVQPRNEEKQRARNQKARETRARNAVIRAKKAQADEEQRKIEEARRSELEEVQRAEESEKAKERKLQAEAAALAKEEEHQRQAQIAALAKAERERAEAAERERLAQALATWKEERIEKLASRDDIAEAVRMAGAVRSYYGRTLHVIALVSNEGAAFEWKAEIRSSYAPTVIGYCDDHEMFTQYAFEGSHQALLAPGRHFLTFYVNASEKPREPDLSFEVHIAAISNQDRWKQAVNETANEFLDAATTVNSAKAKVRKALADQGNDSDEIELHVAKMEMKLQDLSGEQ